MLLLLPCSSKSHDERVFELIKAPDEARRLTNALTMTIVQCSCAVLKVNAIKGMLIGDKLQLHQRASAHANDLAAYNCKEINILDQQTDKL